MEDLGDSPAQQAQAAAKLVQTFDDLVGFDHKAELDWRKQFTVSLAVGNGAGLLAFFNAAGGQRASRLAEVWNAPGWIFLVGVVAAAVCTRLCAAERARMSELAVAARDWVSVNYEPNGPEHRGVIAAVRNLQRAQLVGQLFEWISGLSFVAAVVVAVRAL